MPLEKNETNQNYQYITRRIGSTVYKVKVVFGCEGETMEDKILRLIRNHDCANGSGCDIMDMSQMSRLSERSA